MSDMNFGVNLLPDQTGTRDLGSSNKKWNNIYIDNINGTDVNEFGSGGNIIDIVYPVGSIYMSVVSTSPATLFGGTWEQLEDKFLLGAGSTYTAGDTGGAASVSYTPAGSVDNHTLTTSEIPSHSHGLNSHKHTYNKADSPTGGPSTTNTGNVALTTAQLASHKHGNTINARIDTTGFGNYQLAFGNADGRELNYAILNANAGSGNNHAHTLNSHTHTNSYTSTNSGAASGNTASEGSGRAHNHGFTGTSGNINTMPPYLTVYMWKRTA